MKSDRKNRETDGDKEKSHCTTRQRLYRLQAILQGSKSSLQDNEIQLGTLTGLTLLASTPYNWQSYSLHT